MTIEEAWHLCGLISKRIKGSTVDIGPANLFLRFVMYDSWAKEYTLSIPHQSIGLVVDSKGSRYEYVQNDTSDLPFSIVCDMHVTDRSDLIQYATSKMTGGISVEPRRLLNRFCRDGKDILDITDNEFTQLMGVVAGMYVYDMEKVDKACEGYHVEIGFHSLRGEVVDIINIHNKLKLMDYDAVSGIDVIYI